MARRCTGVAGTPFDRLLIAQALEERIPIITRDEQFAAYGVQLIS